MELQGHTNRGSNTATMGTIATITSTTTQLHYYTTHSLLQAQWRLVAQRIGYIYTVYTICRDVDMYICMHVLDCNDLLRRLASLK
jgi:hypothetical protein